MPVQQITLTDVVLSNIHFINPFLRYDKRYTMLNVDMSKNSKALMDWFKEKEVQYQMDLEKSKLPIYQVGGFYLKLKCESKIRDDDRNYYRDFYKEQLGIEPDQCLKCLGDVRFNLSNYDYKGYQGFYASLKYVKFKKCLEKKPYITDKIKIEF